MPLEEHVPFAQPAAAGRVAGRRDARETPGGRNCPERHGLGGAELEQQVQEEVHCEPRWKLRDVAGCDRAQENGERCGARGDTGEGAYIGDDSPHLSGLDGVLEHERGDRLGDEFEGCGTSSFFTAAGRSGDRRGTSLAAVDPPRELGRQTGGACRSERAERHDRRALEQFVRPRRCRRRRRLGRNYRIVICFENR